MIDWIEQHREILGWLAGGVATAAGGAWVVVRYLLDRSRDGIASAGGMQIVGNISIEHNRIPRGALGHSREIAAITVEKKRPTFAQETVERAPSGSLGSALKTMSCVPLVFPPQSDICCCSHRP
jgi:hypothetical protein